MELIDVRCTTCGGQVTVDQQYKQAKCDSCRNTFLIKQGFELSQKEEYEILSVKKLNENLIRSIEVDDINSIEYFSNKILSIMPNDINALYYGSYASSKTSSPNKLTEFYKNIELDSTDDALDSIINHIVKHFELRDYKKIRIFFESVFPKKLLQLDEAFKLKIQLDENYSLIERDIFVCYSSLNQKFAENLVENLENDGHTCWISSRNLKPNDNNNYWENISFAIENSKLFLVISSQESMFSKDVQKEIFMAKRLNKKRIEYKVDNAIHTTLFNQFFDGIKWINATNQSSTINDELKSRIVDLLYESEKMLFDIVDEAENEVGKSQQNTLYQSYSEKEFNKNSISPKDNKEVVNENISFDQIKNRFPSINVKHLSKGFVSALKDIIFYEEKNKMDIGKYESDIATQIFALETQLSQLEALIQVPKEFLHISFSDKESEKARKQTMNQEIQLENNRIKTHNQNIHNQMSELMSRIKKLQMNTPDVFHPTLNFLKKYHLNEIEKKEINQLEDYQTKKNLLIKELGSIEDTMALKINGIKRDRIMKKAIYVPQKFRESYGEPSIKWVFDKKIMSKIEEEYDQENIYHHARLAVISIGFLSVISIISFVMFGFLSSSLLLFLSFFSASFLTVIFYIWIYRPYVDTKETFTQEIVDEFDNKTRTIIKNEKTSFLKKHESKKIEMINKKEKIEKSLHELEKKYKDFERGYQFDQFIKEVAEFVIGKGEVQINDIQKKFNLGFNDAKRLFLKLQKLGIVSEYGDILIASEELKEILNDQNEH